ncbi:MAG: TIGR00266 family protein [Sphingomonas sp.]|nr:TIGR00266 family protein [Sphingomonas sp.]
MFGIINYLLRSIYMRCHEIDYEIEGIDGFESVKITLDQGEKVIAEAGSMLYMEEGIEMSTHLGDGSNPKGGMLSGLMSAGKRMLAGESVAVTHFTNNHSDRRCVGFHGPYPGTIMGLDLSTVGGVIKAQRGAFLCGAYGTSITVDFTGNISSTLFGGEGLIVQKIEGDGIICLHAGGGLIQRDLKAGESLVVDTGALVAWTEGIVFEAEFSGGVGNMLFSGEGFFHSRVTGQGQGGTVIMQTMPFSKTVAEIGKRLPSR